MIKGEFTFILVLVLLVTAIVGNAIFVNNSIPSTVTAQSISETDGTNIPGNQTIDPESLTETNATAAGVSNLIPYSNPNLGFALQYPSNWEKEETLSFISPQGGIGNRYPELVTITTEVLPTSNFSLDRYTEAALGQVELFQDFKLLNSSSTTLGGSPAHMIVYSFTNEENQLPLQNLQAWAVKDGMAYIITYGGTPEEFDSSLPVLQSVMDSFSLKE